MSRRKSIIVYAALVAGALLGARLVGLFEGESPGREISGLEMLTALFGFLLFLGALIGIVLMIRQNMRPMNEREIFEWEILRRKGRGAYIRQAILKGVLFGLLAISWPVISDYLKERSFDLMVDSLWIYVALFLTCVLGAYYAAIRIWDANERHFEALVQSRPRHGYDSRSGDLE